MPQDHTAAQDADGEWWGWRSPAHLPLTVDGEESWACPRQDLKRRPGEWNAMLFYYGFYKKGHLPQAGAIIDQSSKAMAVFRVFDDINAECDQAEVEKMRGKQAAPQNPPERGRRR